ncbi:hypothetical protein [Sphingomonas nostoxanthinifaciens]|uniref:hypothetical protein n=1 Tax=Sphingomonas nostoxanthinifaciens TaxID=2872652 RepID=UPI001CC1CD30|nr:hypothetical protein [Sphingomonas nostoxanthinifaciens]UAK26805.1 hypothetical protein K8P63_11865 [Sphingomonas nostoxanthinifaciens]
MKLILALTAAVMMTTPVLAAPCRDAKGHFAKCPPAGSASAAAVTKDSKGRCHGTGGKFVACPK